MNKVFYVEDFDIIECLLFEDLKGEQFLFPFKEAYVGRLEGTTFLGVKIFKFIEQNIFTTKGAAKRFLINKIKEK